MLISVIIPNRNDVSKCAIAIRSAIEETSMFGKDAEIIISDNSDKNIQEYITSGKLISNKWGLKWFIQEFPCLFSAFDSAVGYAKGKYILRLDSDMICGHGMIRDMVAFMEKASDDVAFAHAPLNFFSQHSSASQHTVSLLPGKKMCRWDGMRKHGESIPYKGMPWIIRREIYNKLNGYGCLRDKRLTPFGDPYIGIKAWLLGYKNIAINCRAGIHFGGIAGLEMFDKFSNKGCINPKYNSYTTAAVTSYVLTGGFEYAKIFLRVGRVDEKVEEQLNNYIKQNKAELTGLGAQDRKWMLENQKMTFDELIQKQPWTSVTVNQNLYKRTYPIWKSIAGNRPQAGIKEEDWFVLRGLIRSNRIKTVLEFGSGLSTILFDKIGLKVLSYETDAEFMENVKSVCSDNVTFCVWDNKTKPEISGKFDMALVDGVKPRFLQAEIAREHSSLVIVHDIGASSRGVPEKVLPDCQKVENDTKRTGVFIVPDPSQKPTISVIISHRNDFAMLGITARSILEDIIDNPNFGEVIIVDNSGSEEKHNLPHVIAPQAIREGFVRIIHQDYPNLFTARDTGIQVARGKYVMCLDSHVLAGKNMLYSLVDYMENQAVENIGFAHAPLMYVNQNENAKRHEFQTRKYYGKPRKMGIKGMPWICRKDFFIDTGGYGSFSKHKVSWGGGDVYLALKPWLIGFENWAVPCRPAMHIGPYTKLDRKYYRYRLWGKSGETKPWMGLLIASYVFGYDDYPNPVTELRDFHTKSFTPEDWEQAKEMGKEEREWFSKHQKITIDELMNNKPWE